MSRSFESANRYAEVLGFAWERRSGVSNDSKVALLPFPALLVHTCRVSRHSQALVLALSVECQSRAELRPSRAKNPSSAKLLEAVIRCPYCEAHVMQGGTIHVESASSMPALALVSSCALKKKTLNLRASTM